MLYPFDKKEMRWFYKGKETIKLYPIMLRWDYRIWKICWKKCQVKHNWHSFKSNKWAIFVHVRHLNWKKLKCWILFGEGSTVPKLLFEHISKKCLFMHIDYGLRNPWVYFSVNTLDIVIVLQKSILLTNIKYNCGNPIREILNRIRRMI